MSTSASTSAARNLRLAGLDARKWSSIASLWGRVFSYLSFASSTELRPSYL